MYTSGEIKRFGLATTFELAAGVGLLFTPYPVAAALPFVLSLITGQGFVEGVLDSLKELEESRESLKEARQVPAAAGRNAQASAIDATAQKIGDEMPDGTILAGHFEGKPIYITPADAPGTYTFNEAAKYASRLNAHGRHDWHVPTKGELNVLFQNRAAIGGFNTSALRPAGWYWSSSPFIYGFGWAQRFSDGHQSNYFRLIDSSLRCVR